MNSAVPSWFRYRYLSLNIYSWRWRKLGMRSWRDLQRLRRHARAAKDPRA